MKIITIFALLLAFSYAEGECQVFKCHSIEQQDGIQLCAQQTEGEQNQPDFFGVERCSPDQFCQAQKWESPEDVLPDTSLSCGDTSTRNFPPSLEPMNGQALDGDHCEQDSHCFKTEDNAATCEAGVCRASTKSGDICSGNSRNCPKGYFCNIDNICAESLLKGAICTRHRECARNHACIKVKGEQDFVCTEYGTLSNGVLFTEHSEDSFKNSKSLLKNTLISIPDAVGEMQGPFVCKSLAMMRVDGYHQCRSNQRNVDQTYMVDSLDQSCKVQIFARDGAENYDKPIIIETTPRCGFNKNTSAVCPLQPGDNYAMDLFYDSFMSIGRMNCHRLSNSIPFENGRNCKEVWNVRDSQLVFKLLRFYQITLFHHMWANTAANEKCVAQTITYNLWNGMEDGLLD